MYEYAISTKRIAVIAPDAARRGALRSAMALAQALFLGAQSEGADVEIILGYPDDPRFAHEEDMVGLSPQIKRRAFNWIEMDRGTAARAMLYGGVPDWKPQSPGYAAPDDGIKHFCDCDLWVLASDRVPHTLLPIRPSVVVKHAYIQRYDPMWRDDMDMPWLHTARGARAVLATSDLAAQDVLNYAAVAKEKIHEVPLLVWPEELPPVSAPKEKGAVRSFLWAVNEGEHIDQVQIFDALTAYYQTYGGDLDCRVAGLAEPEPDTGAWSDFYETLCENDKVRSRITFLGRMPDETFERELERSAFVLHTDLVDSESLTCLAARRVGVPVLARDFSLMRALDERFGLGLVFTSRDNPRALARALKEMEVTPPAPRAQRAAPPCLEEVAMDYWKVVRACL